MKLKVGDVVKYVGPLADYRPFRGVITTSWKSGLCKGRFQVQFEEMEEYDPSLTCSPADLERIN